MKFNDELKYWIWSNIHNNIPKKIIFNILLENDFDYETIKNELSYDPECNINFSLLKRNIVIPTLTKFNTDKMELYSIDNFLTNLECDKLIEICNKNLAPSLSSSNDNNYRTSSTCDTFDINDTLFINIIEEKMAQLLKISSNYSEKIQIQKYEVGQEFKMHTDFIEIDINKTVSNYGNRTYTFMVYLNNVEKGGETYMISLNEKIKPVKGKALIWYNLDDNGNENRETIHAGLSVVKGTKYIITKWFRQKGDGEPFIS